MFVYHGTGDLNAPFEKTVEAVEKLQAIGAHVRFCPQEGRGHGAPDPETISAYHQWLKTMIGITAQT
jgi:dipeptidyl aminopeptidase/acylaminoacyl peptidase